MLLGAFEWVVGVIGGFVTLSVALISLGLLAWQLWFAAGARRTQGVVIGHAPADSTGGIALPIVRFVASGRSHEFTSGFGTSHDVPAVGQQVPVLYRPRDPRRAMIDSFMARYFVPLAMLGMSLVAATFVGGVVIFLRR